LASYCVYMSDYKQLEWLYEDYEDGIRQASADPNAVDRIAPLKFLEHNMTQQGTANLAWRSGTKMRKHVMQRKVLIYTILRELPDPSAGLPSTDAALHEAIQSIERYRRDKSDRQKKTPLTNMQLHNLLLSKNGPPSEFEQEVLGWSKCPAMQHGNPKHKAGCL